MKVYYYKDKKPDANKRKMSESVPIGKKCVKRDTHTYLHNLWP